MKSSYSSLNLEKKRRVKAFQQHACYVLTEAEREKLYKALKEYQKYRRVDKLVQNLKLLLNTPEKKDLVLKVRQLIPPSHLTQFDQWVTRTKLSGHKVHVHSESMLYRSAENISHAGLHENRSPAMRARKHPMAMANRSRIATRILSKQMNGKQEEVDDVRVVTITKSEEESLGLAVRGGAEHGLGIYVSQVDEDSAADFAGLSPGDEILEVNDRTLSDLPSSTAVKILTASNNLRLLLRRTGKIPGWRYSSEQISWYDTEKKQIVKGNLQDYDSPESMLGPFLNGISERRVNISVRKREHKQGLGFNIRGGSEFGLGIYVSRVDRGGLAEQKGVRVGDQLLSVNGTSIQGMSHAEAVDFLRTQSQLVLTVRYIGRFPVLKELYAEYQWLNGQKTCRSRPGSRGSMSDFPLQRVARIPQESKVEVYTQTDDEDSSQLSLDIHTEEVLPLQTEILMPHSSQFILRDSNQQHNSSGSDLDDLLLEHFENGIDDSFHDPKDLSMMKTSSGAESSGDVSPELDLKRVTKRTERKTSTSSRKSHRKKTSVGRKSLNKHDDTLSSYSGSIRIRGMFEKSFGSQVMHRGSIGGSSMMAVEERCRAVLSQDESAAVIRHIHSYKGTKDIERLVQVLLVILDKPEKVLVLRDIRGVIQPTDIGRFDSMVTRYERQASMELKTSSAVSSPVRNVKDKPPRTRKLMDPVTDLRGSFHLEEHGHFTDKYRKGDNSKSQPQPAEYSSDPEGDVTSQSVLALSSASPHKRSDIIFLPATNPIPTDMPEYAEIHHVNGQKSRPEDRLDTLSVGSSGSSVDSSPVAFDEADLPPGWLRSGEERKVEMRSYTLAEERRQSLRSPAKDMSSGPASSNKYVTRSHDAASHSPSRSPSRGESVRSESRSSPHQSLSRHSSYMPSPIRYVTAMAPPDSLRGQTLSSPPPPLLISPAGSQAPPVPPPFQLPTPPMASSPMSPPPMFNDTSPSTRIVYLRKDVGSLGLSISGGRESKTQPQVKVEKILPGGSAAQEGILRSGMRILAVDGESLQSVTHTQAVDVIRRAWNNPHKRTIDVEVEEKV